MWNIPDDAPVPVCEETVTTTESEMEKQMKIMVFSENNCELCLFEWMILFFNLDH